MSVCRPECGTAPEGTCSMNHRDSFFRILQAVSKRRALCHGRLHKDGKSCAIGATFDDGVPALRSTVIDEVAAYNDSFPNLSNAARWKKVVKWLRWRCEVFKVSGE